MKKLHSFKIVILFIILILIINKGESQVLINSAGGTPDPSSILEVRSTTQGLLIPRMETTQREGILNPADGLLVFDSDENSFYIFGDDKWNDLSTPAGIWETSSSNVYLSSSYTNVGIGTGSPGGKLVIKADASKGPDDALFEIQDATGTTIFEVTSEGARLYVKDVITSKGNSGGFAVGRYGTAKDLPKEIYLMVTPDSTRVYSTQTGVSGGFAVGRYGTAKGSDSIYFYTNVDQTKVTIFEDKAKGVSGGFAVGRYGTAKGEADSLFFYTTIDSTRVYTDGRDTKGVSGGFAVGRYGTAKGGANTYMHMTKQNYFIGHQAGLNTDPTAAGDSGKYNLFFGYESAITNTKGYHNTFVGHLTGYSNTQGRDNVFMGNKAGYNNTGGTDFAGSRNVFLGYEAGYKNTTGADNVMLGYQAGRENTTAGSNICIGSLAGFSNTTSNHNIFMGEFAGQHHKIGENNIYMGFSSGMASSHVDSVGTGHENVFIGFEAGATNTIGSANVFLGNVSGHSNTRGINNVFIGNNSGHGNTTGANNVILGSEAGILTTEGINNVFLGNNSGFSNATGSTNVFIGNGAGSDIADHHDNIFIGGFAGFNAEGGDNNIFMGVAAGQYHYAGNDNVILGNKAGIGVNTYVGSNQRNVLLGANAGAYVNGAIDNIFIGHKAGEGSSLNPVTGDFNVIIGEQAGNHLTSGEQNVFLGNEAGFSNTSGNGNIFLGYQCGYANTSGGNNTFIGYLAGQSNSTGTANMFLGSWAGRDNSTGGFNTAIGVAAGRDLTEGDNNIFIGTWAGRSVTTGGGNIHIGTLVGSHTNLDPTSSDNVFIGFNAGYYVKKGTENVLLGNGAGRGSSWANDTLGSRNTIIGDGAGYEMRGNNNTTLGYRSGRESIGSRNIYIGYDMWGQGIESNKLYINNDNDATPLIYGEFDRGYLQINDTLNIAGEYTFPSVDGAANEVMMAHADGTVTWEDVNTVVTGDNLGNHTATEDLDMGTFNVTNVDKVITLATSDYDKLRVYNHADYTIGMHSGMSLGYLSNYAMTFTMGNSTGNRGWVWRYTTDAQSAGAMSLTTDGRLYVDNTAHFNGSVGIGNSVPVAKLEVRNSGTEDILNLFDGTTEVMTVEDGGDIGIGTTNPGYKLHVVDNTTSNDDFAIYGVHAVTAGDGRGVFGQGNWRGVQGYVWTSASHDVAGIYGYAYNGGSGNAYAGYFSGNASVTGTLSKGGGSFKIDHPLDPENKYLYHSFVESPDMMNIYNGNIILDGSGEAIVTMPDYFEALNMEFRYQLTAIGAPGPNLYIAKEISGNTFKIAGGTSGMKVSWQVTGIRHDPFANENRIKVEVDKNTNERGKYLHPDAYNQPKEKGIDYEMINK